jgi:hypothetical protein
MRITNKDPGVKKKYSKNVQSSRSDRHLSLNTQKINQHERFLISIQKRLQSPTQSFS